MTDRELMQQALDGWDSRGGFPILAKAMEAIRERLAQPEQEPVAWLSTDSIGERHLCFDKPLDNDPVQPLYTTPPQRTWVGLMDEQIDNVTRKQVDALLDHIYEYGTAAEGIDLRVRAVARAIEAKLKEKNA